MGQQGSGARHPWDIVVGRRLRAGRVLSKLTQEQLGAAIGVAFQQVQKYEDGRNRISASRLAAAAVFLKLPIGYFFEGIEGMPSGLDPVWGALLPALGSGGQAARVAMDFAKIEDAEVRRFIAGLIYVLAGKADPSAVSASS